MAHHSQGGYDYSTLEVDDQRLPEPVNVNTDYYPETAHGGTYKKTFWIVLCAGVLVVVTVVVGVVAAVLAPKSGSGASDEPGDSTKTTTSNTTLYNNTRLTSANFPDEQGNDNYLVVYQLANRVLYMSAWNPSHKEWIVLPIIDGTTDVSLDDVQAGTGLGLDVLGLDVYWHGGVFSLVRLQCYYCAPWTYFWQRSEGAIHGAWRTTESKVGWGDITLTQNVNRPVANSSLAVTNVPSINGTPSVDIFYQSQAGVLTHIIFDGDERYSAVSLPRGNLVDRDSDTGVHPTYYKDGSWTAGDDVTALSNCVTRATLAANSDRRIYCLVDGVP
ncbi:hypothetical protein DL766_000312 [Monosporascus sp. MC13-8B]|uniref:Fucose-specific lectin n=1 Tax=Monosporascus cannonballus TaxID=155416 RepID=A0ABY0H2R3_9PEZI|nr:hypothetical protein DL762_006558 [Monosporascus cannonballus]RYO84334.1 hypothetical protein DL763_007505 [Monosporascus cannonballus]RYP39650.1 hypothetical protein DL766_000312 [Monosporascus sp. MC13-8B]